MDYTNPDPCPFCGGKGKVSFKDYRFIGQNMRGDVKKSYRIQVICNRCKSRGAPVITDALLNPNPYVSRWGNTYSPESDRCQEQTALFEPYVKRAIDAWNTRTTGPAPAAKAPKAVCTEEQLSGQIYIDDLIKE